MSSRKPRRWLAWIVWRTFRWQSGRPPFAEVYEGLLKWRAEREATDVADAPDSAPNDAIGADSGGRDG